MMTKPPKSKHPRSDSAASKTDTETVELNAAADTFPVVGVGASAGGLQVFTELLEVTPADSGMAFVLIQHLDPQHESHMVQLLEGRTNMTVVQAADNAYVEPNHVYVIPPKAALFLENGRLRVVAPTERHGARFPIDGFFRSLAEDRKNRAVGIVLSGTGTDGTLGLRAIREAGGLAIAQEPTEAPYDGMPYNAISNGATDQVLPVADIPQALAHYAEHPYFLSKSQPTVLGDRARPILKDIVELLKRHNRMDYTLYKEGTLLRRIERRMGICQLKDGANYLKLLRDDRNELDRLSKDLLINISSFFRDREVFDYLENEILPDIISKHPSDRPFRVWVAGCATGEEAYSIAMLLVEQTMKQKRHLKIQVFATDVDENVLSTARNGVYPESIETQVSPERLVRFFTKDDHRYTVKPELRETIVFAVHNLLSDAPFSKLDFVSCRNVLIYLDAKIQRRIIELFHFALNDNGILLLGTSETINSENDRFFPQERKWRIYKRKGGRARIGDREVPIIAARGQRATAALHSLQPPHRMANPSEIARNRLLECHTPAAVLIDRRAHGLYFSGPVDHYLKVPFGEAGQNLLAMAREGLRIELRSTLNAAIGSGKLEKSTGTWVKRDGVRARVEIQVDPIDNGEDRLFLVTFTDAPEAKVAEIPPMTTDQTVRAQLENELQRTRRELKLTIQDLEASNEELKASNEEAMSMNEEFQSTNEELETSKEELQSLNEELTTLNSQLQQKADENRMAANDLNNLLNNSQIATVFLDRLMHIKRFTPSAKEVFNLIASDEGRPFSDITHRLDDTDLLEDVRKVLATFSPIETEVSTKDGRWLQRRILPYRRLDDKVDGAVITLHDISKQKRAQEQAETERNYSAAIVDAVREPLIILDGSLRITSASRSFYAHFETNREATEGRYLYELEDGAWANPELQRRLQAVISKSVTFQNYELTFDFPRIGKRMLDLSGRLIPSAKERPNLILLAIEDLTEQRLLSLQIEERNALLESILQSAQVAIISIDQSGIVQSFGAAAETLFGYRGEEVIGKNVNILMPEPFHSEHDGYLAAYKKTGRKNVIGIGREVTGRRKDGSLIPLDLSVGEAVFDHSRVFTGIMRDLTSDKQRQEELIQAQKMDAMGRMTGGVAHDFNNLLMVIQGNLEMIDALTEDPQQKSLLKRALEASNNGARLTKYLLAFARRQPLETKIVDLNTLIVDMAEILKQTLGEAVDISTSLASSLLPVSVDLVQFQSAMLNLAVNARDAMPKGGTFAIKTTNVEAAEHALDEHGVVEKGKYVLLSISDTGQGMTEDVQKRIFEPFFTTKEQGLGSGLGLSMVYGFVTQCGGTISVDSQVGRGTSFDLYFPAASQNVEKSSFTPGEAIPMGRGETILLVEDNALVRSTLCDRLETLGYKVIEANDGPAGLRLIKDGAKFDVLFTDLIMPGGMSGQDLAEAARKIQPAVKVIFSSGYADPTVIEKEKFGKHDLFLQKPYSQHELAAKISEILD